MYLEVKDAQRLLENAGLKLGEVLYDNSDTVQSGLVISQKPEALAKENAGAKVSLTVSLGKKAPDKVAVPNLIGLNQTDAEKAISNAGLIGVPGDPVVSSDVAPGLVCQQSIAAGTQVDEGTQIAFATALEDNKVSVPDLVGEPFEGASSALTNLGLGFDKSTSYSDSFDEGIVMSQSVDFGVEVPKGTIVTLCVSLGPAPAQQVEVPDVYTYTLDDAAKALESAGLDYRYTGEEDGTVIAMNPDAGTTVDEGTVVSLRLQHKSSTVEVPDIVGMSGDDALEECKELGLGLKYDESMGNQPLIAQNPPAGTLVDPGFVVEGTEPDPEPTTVAVPNVVGMTGDDALGVINDAGLKFKYDESRGSEELTATKPAAGTEVKPGSMVEGIFPDRPQPATVEIPDLSGMKGKDAAAALKDLGLVLDYDKKNPNMEVMSTDPDAGTTVDAGTKVEAIYGGDADVDDGDDDNSDGSADSGGSEGDGDADSDAKDDSDDGSDDAGDDSNG